AVAPDEPFDATVAALAAFAVAGETAARAANGPGSFSPLFLDALYGLDALLPEADRKVLAA
ncbi:MAG: hydroxyethylthiazole kinase, partial [Bosea sp. (in: a-proteobacteria)]